MKTWIKTLETSDGYLRHAKISFVEGLTCIIGARGTCKSTIVETLRFVHDLDRARIKALVGVDAQASLTGGLLKATLASGTAVCTIGTVDEHGVGSELRVERSIGLDGTSRPRVYRDGVLDPSAPAALPIEIYSQGDLVAIAESP